MRWRIFVLMFLLIFISCKNDKSKSDVVVKSATIVNIDNKADIENYKKLNLDSSYPNLLDPRISKETYKEVFQSWTQFHQGVTRFIKDENFNWGVQDSTITVMNKIYFSKDGNIEYYFFKIMNPSIPLEKKREFEDVLNKFSANIKLDLQRDSQFAQCGKTKYLNY